MKKKMVCLAIVFLSMGLVARVSGENELIVLNTENLSLVMEVDDRGVLLHRYFGKRLQDPSPFLSKTLYRTDEYGTRNEAYSTMGGKNFREPALRVTHHDGDLNTELRYARSERMIDHDKNRSELVIHLEDTKHPFRVKLVYRAYRAEDTFTMHAEIENGEEGEVVLGNYYSFYLPVEARGYWLTHFHGIATTEMSVVEARLTPGMKTIQSRKGLRSTHSENPSFLLSLDGPLRENGGEVIAGALAWGGNYRINFDLDEFGTLNISAGINPYASEYRLSPEETFVTPEMVFTYSARGAGDASRNLHDWARKDGLYDPAAIRPVVLNSWEGVYFDFDEKVLREMIDGAAALGIEMFVLDDGWFGNNYPRNSAAAGLGDWQVNKDKLPGGIDALARYAESKGVKFGIWIEPEMVNPRSDLANRHPEWIVKAGGREVPTRRNQWVLDMTNPEVQDFVFDTFDSVLKLSDRISYVKWDANRHIESVGSAWLPPERQSHFWVDYTRGLYKVYERIREKYPDIIIQACSSGGGRVDYGSLKYHQDFWTSDNTDAFSRAFIQYGTNLVYPAIATGAHFSHVPNRHTRRIIPAKFRMDMAMTGRLGFEMKLADLTSDEAAPIKKAIAQYKQVRDIIQFGDLYRIVSPYDESGYYALMYVSKDKKRALFFAFCLDYKGYLSTVNFKLNGLDGDTSYRIRELNNEKPAFWAEGRNIDGDFLMKEGINPNLQNIYQSMVLYLEASQDGSKPEEKGKQQTSTATVIHTEEF
ncbi:alpha-galactosidase [Proteiniphilum sp. X52]|nr:alpha-galactosidase [Proteiniphilum sp. X52]